MSYIGSPETRRAATGALPQVNVINYSAIIRQIGMAGSKFQLKGAQLCNPCQISEKNVAIEMRSSSTLC